jgi:hypothetical protein
MRIIVATLALAFVATPALADEFVQARCAHPGHHAEWHGPRRSEPRSQQALRDADQHNRRHRGHVARVLVVARDE